MIIIVIIININHSCYIIYYIFRKCKRNNETLLMIIIVIIININHSCYIIYYIFRTCKRNEK